MQTFTYIKKKFYYPKVFLSFIYLFKYTVKFPEKKNAILKIFWFPTEKIKKSP